MKIERLGRETKDRVVAVLVDAFYDYPVMRYVLKNAGAEYEPHLKELIGFFTESRFAKENPVLGIFDNGDLVAISLVDDAAQRKWQEGSAEMERLRMRIGVDAYARLEAYEAASSALEPKEPHYFLGMIGVMKKYQGKGYARIMLDAVKDLSCNDSASAGVCLSTETAKNVPLYEKFGYRVIAEVDVEELHSWCLYQTTKSQRL